MACMNLSSMSEVIDLYKEQQARQTIKSTHTANSLLLLQLAKHYQSQGSLLLLLLLLLLLQLLSSSHCCRSSSHQQQLLLEVLYCHILLYFCHPLLLTIYQQWLVFEGHLQRDAKMAIVMTNRKAENSKMIYCKSMPSCSIQNCQMTVNPSGQFWNEPDKLAILYWHHWS